MARIRKSFGEDRPDEDAAAPGTAIEVLASEAPESAAGRMRAARRFPSLGGPGPIAAVFLCGVFAFLDLYATQPLLPLLIRVFHASKAQAGLTISASTFGVALAAPLLGVFAEKLSRRKVILWSLFALVAPTMLAGSSQSLGALVFWRFLQGLVIPGIFAMTITYITEQWLSDSVSLVMSVYVSGSALGGFLGRLITGLVADHASLHTTWHTTWRSSFVLLGALTLVGALLVLRWLPVERGRSAVGDASAGAGSKLRPLLDHLSNRKVLATCWAGFNVLFSLVAIFTYVTFYLAEPPFGLSIAKLSYLFVVYLVGLVVTPAAGLFLPRIGLRAGMVWATLLSSAGIATTLAPRLPLVVLGLALMCTGVFISQACATSYLREATPAGGRAAAIGLYVCCYYVGGTVGGVVPSYAWKLGGWPACVGLVALFECVTIAVAVFGWRSAGTTEDYLP